MWVFVVNETFLRNFSIGKQKTGELLILLLVPSVSIFRSPREFTKQQNSIYKFGIFSSQLHFDKRDRPDGAASSIFVQKFFEVGAQKDALGETSSKNFCGKK